MAAELRSASVIDVALSQIGYTEGPNESTKYGRWYGIPNGYWCDMFASWCAMTAGIPERVFPYAASCTLHVKAFQKRDQYRNSAARGGSYTPRQGDLIFFYNPARYPKADRQSHVGIVLYAENGYVFTIEGNALYNRVDHPEMFSQILSIDEVDPIDYVCVNQHPINDPHIHGYGVPAYTDRAMANLKGFVDLAAFPQQAAQMKTLAQEGILKPTSSHTLSPGHGMMRGEFLVSLMKLYGLSGWEPNTRPFDDVPFESPYYEAVMTARSAGIISGNSANKFLPDIYISGPSAQAVLSATLAYVGQADRTFTMKNGDYAHLFTPYVIRADLSSALYALREELPLPAPYTAQLLVNGAPVSWDALQVNNACAIPLDQLLAQLGDPTAVSLFEEPSAVVKGDTAEAVPSAETGTTETAPLAANTGKAELVLLSSHPRNGSVNEPIHKQEVPKPTVKPDGTPHQPIPFAHTDRVLLQPVTVEHCGITAEVDGFLYEGRQYVLLRSAADSLGIDVTWDPALKAINLTSSAFLPVNTAPAA